jgi:hypothetical protein
VERWAEEGGQVSAPEADVRNNNKVHTVYKSEDGKRLPSVTTVLSILAKPALIKWAYGLGVKGIDMDGYRDALADVGTLAHRMILDHLRGDKTDTTNYPKAQVDLAENCFIKYLAWEKAHKIEPIIIEEPLVSVTHGYGGTPDFYGRIDGVLTLMDFKTGKAIYDDFWYQLGGYDLLLAERVKPEEWPTSLRILNIGRSEDEKFVEETRSSVAHEAQIFLHTLAIYKLKRKTN